MATWRDGPEYAPKVRPDSFLEPDSAGALVAVGVLRTDETTPTSAAGPDSATTHAPPSDSTAAPTEIPAFAPPAQAPALESLVPTTHQPREATEPFSALSTGLVSEKAPRSPLEPFTTIREVTDPTLAPPPVAAAQYRTPSMYPAAQVNPPAFQQSPPPPSTQRHPGGSTGITQESAYALLQLAVLGVGVVFDSLSLLAFIAAFVLLLRTREPAKVLMSIYLVGSLFILASAVSPLLVYSLTDWPEAWYSANQTANLICLVIIGVSAFVSFGSSQKSR